MADTNKNIQEEVIFIGKNYKRKQTKYEDKGGWSKKKICCFCCLGCLLTVLLVVGGSLVYVFTRPDLSSDATKWDAMLGSGDSSGQITLDGTYTLVSYDDTYGEYLSAMGVPWFVKPIILGGSESITIQDTGAGAEIYTQTGWISQEMKFDWDSNFSMAYGKGPFQGFMSGICTKPSVDTVTCSILETEKGWNMSTKFVFSEMGMVNERILLTSNVGTKKYYKREVTDSEVAGTTDAVEDVTDEEDESWDF